MLKCMLFGRNPWTWIVLLLLSLLYHHTDLPTDSGHAYEVRSEINCALIKTRSSIERTIVIKIWIKHLHTLPVLHFNHCLTTEYSETTAHFNGNFDTDNQI
jgi:hypothetical protein